MNAHPVSAALHGDGDLRCVHESTQVAHLSSKVDDSIRAVRRSSTGMRNPGGATPRVRFSVRVSAHLQFESPPSCRHRGIFTINNVTCRLSGDILVQLRRQHRSWLRRSTRCTKCTRSWDRYDKQWPNSQLVSTASCTADSTKTCTARMASYMLIATCSALASRSTSSSCKWQH